MMDAQNKEARGRQTADAKLTLLLITKAIAFVAFVTRTPLAWRVGSLHSP
jgi:hypothetical protein